MPTASSTQSGMPLLLLLLLLLLLRLAHLYVGGAKDPQPCCPCCSMAI
jgi:hypothetical protein